MASMSGATSRPFVKMNGAGNDFVVVNALDRPFTPGPDAVRALGAREAGRQALFVKNMLFASASASLAIVGAGAFFISLFT